MQNTVSYTVQKYKKPLNLSAVRDRSHRHWRALGLADRDAVVITFDEALERGGRDCELYGFLCGLAGQQRVISPPPKESPTDPVNDAQMIFPREAAALSVI